MWVVLQRVLSVNIISATAFLVYLYGFMGLFMRRELWQRTLVPFVLISMTLPFGNLMDIYLGFPLRMLAVKFVSNTLFFFGFHHITESTIVATENGAAQIDFSCSGLKGIWSGLLFYFILTWLQKLQLHVKWLLLLLCMLVGLFISNLLRILLIVLLTTVFNLELFAAILHASFGVIGYLFVCAGVYWVASSAWFAKGRSSLHLLSRNRDRSVQGSSQRKNSLSSLFLIMLLFLLSFIPSVEIEPAKELTDLKFPENWETEPLLLSSEEEYYFKVEGSSGSKYSFLVNEDIAGSILLVKSSHWRGHHNPEFCIRAGGNTIDAIQTKLIQPNLPIKWLDVNEHTNACYWFQSPSMCTDDYGTRVWQEIQNETKNWILVSVVFNTIGVDKQKEMHLILDSLYACVHQQYLKGVD